MEAAATAFLVTSAILGGLLSPIIILMILAIVASAMKSLCLALINKAEEIKKAPPFDDVQLNLNPSTNVLTGRIIKDDAVLWQGSVRRTEDDI